MQASRPAAACRSIRRGSVTADGGRPRLPGSRPPPAARTTGPARAGGRRRRRPRRGPPSPGPRPAAEPDPAARVQRVERAMALRAGAVQVDGDVGCGARPRHGGRVGCRQQQVDAPDALDERGQRGARRQDEPVLRVGPAQRAQRGNGDEQVADLQSAQGEDGGSGVVRPVVRHRDPVPALRPPDPAGRELIVRVLPLRQPDYPPDDQLVDVSADRPGRSGPVRAWIVAG